MVYICIPAYNEERTIGVVLWKIRQVMSEFDRDYQVLVVDDGSTDGTGDVMEPYARIMPLHVRRHQHRQGYAVSLEALVREAVARTDYPKRDVAVTLQADFTDEPEDIADLVKRIEGGADVVTGNVHLEGGDVPRVFRWSRSAWHTLLRWTRGADVEGDQLSGFRAYRIIALQKAVQDTGQDPLLTTEGWAANAELLHRVAPHSRRTEAVDVQVRPSRRQRESRWHLGQASAELFRLLRSGRPAVAPAPAEAASGTGLTEERGRRRGPRGARGGASGRGTTGRTADSA